MPVTIANENKASVGELLRGSDDVLDHPIMREIVDAAPTAKAADEYVLSLGWGNSLARKVRLAVTARLKCEPREWSKFSASTARPAIQMFKFEQSSFTRSPVEPDDSELLISMALTASGEQVAQGNMPFFLREIARHDREELLTSMDGFGLHRIAKIDDLRFLPFDFNFVGGKVYDRDLQIWIGQNESSWGFGGSGNNGKLKARAGLYMVQPTLIAQQFPEFYKVVDFEQILGDSGERQRMRVCVRMDFGPNDPQNNFRGWIELQLHSQIHYSVYYHTPVRFNVWGDGQVTLDKEHYNLGGPTLIKNWECRPGGCGAFHEVNSGPGFDKLHAVTSAHWATLCDIYSRDESRFYPSGKPYLNLSRFASLKLVTDPPDRLSNLFVND